MQDEDLTLRLEAARDAARAAGALARKLFRGRAALAVESKGLQDFVSRADREVEEAIRARIAARFPDDSFLGEELGGGRADRLWIVDPIDGTTNFLRGVPYFCVSIAFAVDGVAEIGVIYDPMADETFVARRGRGATRDGAPVAVSGCREIGRATIGVGFSYRTEVAPYVDALRRLMEAGCENRRMGAGALMLAHVADGRFDGYFELHLNSWDGAAGALLVAEAGGWVSEFLEGDGLTEGAFILACAPGIAPDLLRLIGPPPRIQPKCDAAVA